MTFVICTPVQTFWGWTRAFFQKTSSRSCQSIRTACAGKYGTILDNEKYIEKLCELYRGKVADLIKSGYNIDENSMYAAQMRALGRYDEVMTEYRTHEVLKGR